MKVFSIFRVGIMLKIALLSTDIVWEEPDENMRRCEKFIAQIFESAKKYAGDTVPDIVVLPELFATGFSMNPNIAEREDGATSRWMREISVRYDCALLASVPVLDGGLIYNRALFMTSSKAEYYDKRHLFSYGGESEVFTRGIRRPVVNYKGFNILIQVCYDLRFPVWCRNRNLEYDLIVNIANWPASRARVVEPMCRSRAIENQAYSLFVNRSGSDEKSDYDGEKYAFDYMGDAIPPLSEGDGYSIFGIDMDGVKAFREKFRAWEDADEFVLFN